MLTLIQRAWTLFRTAKAAKTLRQSDDKQVQQKARATLNQLLGDARGLPMKVGQVMAGMGDDSDYARLTTSIEPWPLKKMLPVLEKEWGKPPMMVLHRIEESQAAASLGQVHAAWLSPQEKIAIKIQYPDIAQAIQAEMTLAGLMPTAGPVKTWAFDMQAYKQTLRDNMNHELDYLHEMKQQMRFAGEVHVEGLQVPMTYPLLCRKHVLVQAWVEGVRLSEVATWALPQRLFVARTLMQTMFQSLFQVGLVHGDPHPGNMLFSRDKTPTTYLLDFGCMVSVQEHERMALLNMVLYARGERQVDLLALFKAMGFDAQKLQHIQAKLPMLVQLLCQPFVEKKPFNVGTWQLSAAVEALLGDDKWWFRSAAPAQLFLIIRIFQGLVSQLELLQVQLPWWPLLEQALKGETWAKARAWQTERVSTSAPIEVPGSARALSIRLQPKDKKEMNITLTAASALDLASLMPEHIAQEMEDAGVDLLEIRERLLKNGLEPQVLLELNMPSYHCRIELLP